LDRFFDRFGWTALRRHVRSSLARKVLSVTYVATETRKMEIPSNNSSLSSFHVERRSKAPRARDPFHGNDPGANR
jgi:hypothetical protein